MTTAVNSAFEAISQVDPELLPALHAEVLRQQNTLELIASENHVSAAILSDDKPGPQEFAKVRSFVESRAKIIRGERDCSEEQAFAESVSELNDLDYETLSAGLNS